MEFDCYQHYFFNDFDTEEDFYKSTAPSEDIWKKFELLPTPPMSPTRTLSGGVPQLSPGDKLSWLSKVLGQDEDKQLEKVNGKVSAAAQTSVSPLAQISVRPNKAQCVSPSGPLATSATDCVDPAAVLTIPASSCRKPASSGSESRSDSSDDEEIDVVTVESKQNLMRLQHNYAARSPDSDPEPEEEDDDDDDDDEEEEEDEYEEEPQSKRSCTASSQHAGCSARVSQPASPSETPQNSDAEDTDRRRNHNFLERKRRNDLRSRFLALRDQVPGLESAKTPKVAILTHATEYLVELHIKEKRQLQEKKRLKVRQQQLFRRLSELKRS
ncbi:Protein L-Myc-1b [Larimichthys crocea]|uniref:Protein L-Myc-1b n=1 Tax=Larimichthys crocea TaxID=215358 RepID=A0A6G0IE31_LARCR|nr:Protein L-Myc-1b [Larimichthys crocea]